MIKNILKQKNIYIILLFIIIIVLVLNKLFNNNVNEKFTENEVEANLCITLELIGNNTYNVKVRNLQDDGDISIGLVNLAEDSNIQSVEFKPEGISLTPDGKAFYLLRGSVTLQNNGVLCEITTNEPIDTIEITITNSEYDDYTVVMCPPLNCQFGECVTFDGEDPNVTHVAQLVNKILSQPTISPD